MTVKMPSDGLWRIDNEEMKGKWVLLGGAVILAAIASGALVWWRGHQTRVVKPAAKQDQSVAAAGSLDGEFSAGGKIGPVNIVPVKSPIEGVIEEVFADTGAEVYESQLLARVRNGKLDATLETATAETEKVKTKVSNLEGSIIAARLESSRADADYERAKEAFEKAEKTYQRQQMLYREGATPRLTFEKSEKDYEQAKAEANSAVDVAKASAERVEALQKDLDLAKKQLDDKHTELETAKAQVDAGEVHAPVDGVIMGRRGSPGEQINPLQDFFQVGVRLTELQVALDAPPPILDRCKAGQPAVVRVAEVSEEIAGKIREVKAGQVFVEFTSPNPAIVKPGLTATVRLKLQ